MAASETLEVSTSVGSIKNLPHSLLGWVVLAAMALFLVWSLVTKIDTKLESMLDASRKQTEVLQRILEKLP